MTRPSWSRNWYEPGESGIEPGSGRVNMVTFSPTSVTAGYTAFDRRVPVSGAYEGSEADNPVVWRPGCHPPADEEPTPLGRLNVRLQIPLPDDYTLATPDELEARIRTAKDALGERLLVLAHHYQREEVY